MQRGMFILQEKTQNTLKLNSKRIICQQDTTTYHEVEAA